MEATNQEIGEQLRANESFLILAHLRPDGDAYGSTLGLAHSLRTLGKDVIACNEDGMNDFYRFLPGSDTLIPTPEQPPEATRLIIALDCGDPRRLGDRFAVWNRPPDINIDHHISNPGYGKLNLIDDTAAATAHLLARLLREEKLPCPPQAAAALFVGLSTDTGSFRFQHTSAETFHLAAWLVEHGADARALAEACYKSYPPGRLMLLRAALNDAKLVDDDRIAYYHITGEMYARCGATPNDAEGIIDTIQSVRTVEVAFMVEDIGDGFRRCSLRSRGEVDVQEIASLFDGGGHRQAAGLRSRLPLADLEAQLLEAIRARLS